MLLVSVASFFTNLFGEEASIGLGTLFLIATLILFLLALKPEEKDPGTITAEQAAAQLKGLFSHDRVQGIANLYHDLPDQLSGKQVAIILGSELHSLDRVKAIKVLKPKISKTLPPEEYEYILGGLFSSDRGDAIKVLSTEENIKKLSKPNRRY